METILSIDSITVLHEIAGYEKPKHPLISLIDISKIRPLTEQKDVKVRLGFYCVSLKTGIENRIRYGRQFYDFQEGSLVFMAPNQVMTIDIVPTGAGTEGWMLCFHPELIRGSELSKKMDDYSFFSYSVNESLHLSDKEKAIITGIVDSIREEYSQNIDAFSRKLILTNIELLLNYSERYYGRQFLTRQSANKDIINEFETLLKKHFQLDFLAEKGMPSVKQLAKEMGYSTYYLSDLLKKETGKNTQDYIHEYVIERAKDLLISTTEPISQIGYKLGFEYPTHFSKFFKKKTGMTPSKFRS